MFGLTFEKLIILGVVAAFVIGPERLPHYASVLAKFVRQLRDFTNGAKSRMKEEMGPEFDEVEWKKLDPRQYDPRRIIRDALLEDPAPATTSTVKPSSPMAAGAAAGAAAAGTAAAGAASAGGVGAPGRASAMAASAAGSPTAGSPVSLDKDAPADMGGASLAADPGFDAGPAVSLSVPAAGADSPDGTGTGTVSSTPAYLSGRKTLDRESAEAVTAPELVSPYDSEAT